LKRESNPKPDHTWWYRIIAEMIRPEAGGLEVEVGAESRLIIIDDFVPFR
jgi:hypothetical protein